MESPEWMAAVTEGKRQKPLGNDPINFRDLGIRGLRVRVNPDHKPEFLKKHITIERNTDGKREGRWGWCQIIRLETPWFDPVVRSQVEMPGGQPWMELLPHDHRRVCRPRNKPSKSTETEPLGRKGNPGAKQRIAFQGGV